MKKTIALLFTAAIALSAAGCAVTVEPVQVPLSNTAGVGTSSQAIVATALGAKADATIAVPAKVDMVTGKNVLSNDKAAVDASNAAEGYLLIKYTGGKKMDIVVQIYSNESNKYQYTLNGSGTAEAFPLSEGDGKYTVKILEVVPGSNKGSVAYSCTVDVKLRNALLPFLYSTKYVDYSLATETVKKAESLVKDIKTDVGKVEAIYKFVVGTLSYDNDFASKIVSGAVTSHVPVLDTTLSTKTGICFDYAALMAGMLRSQGVPTKMVHGYAGTVYHAWINVFIQGVGWVDKVIYFDGKNWTMMDPTFVSTSKNADAVSKFVSDGKSYTAKQSF